jgi:hypothetical protein
MKRNQSLNVVPLLVFIIVIALAQLACGSSTSGQLASAVPPTAAAQEVSESAPAPTAAGPASESEPTQLPAEQMSPTDSPEPTAEPVTPTAVPEAISLVAQGFGQDGQQVGFAFIVENPNAGYAVENSQYQVAAYDANGAVLKTESGYIELVLPGQSLGVGNTMYVDEGVTVSRIETQLKAGDVEATDLSTTFAVDKVVYRPSDMFSKAFGVVTNPFDRDITELRVSAVAFNDAGEIVGGGFTYLNFILAGGTTGVGVSVTSAGQVARVELYPTVSGLSLLARSDDLPEGAQKLALVKQGYGRDGAEVGCGMLVQNPNDGFAVESTMYHITLYAGDGSVVATEGGYIDTLLPGQVLGTGTKIYLAEELGVASADMQIKAGRFEPSSPIPTFTAENVSYQPDEYFPKVTGEILSPYNQDITNVRASAIAYNEAGDIIGCGFTYVDFVPANGQAAVEVSVTSAGTPTTVELYAAVSALSDFD